MRIKVLLNSRNEAQIVNFSDGVFSVNYNATSEFAPMTTMNVKYQPVTTPIGALYLAIRPNGVVPFVDYAVDIDRVSDITYNKYRNTIFQKLALSINKYNIPVMPDEAANIFMPVVATAITAYINSEKPASQPTKVETPDPQPIKVETPDPQPARVETPDPQPTRVETPEPAPIEEPKEEVEEQTNVEPEEEEETNAELEYINSLNEKLAELEEKAETYKQLKEEADKQREVEAEKANEALRRVESLSESLETLKVRIQHIDEQESDPVYWITKTVDNFFLILSKTSELPIDIIEETILPKVKQLVEIGNSFISTQSQQQPPAQPVMEDVKEEEKTDLETDEKPEETNAENNQSVSQFGVDLAWDNGTSEETSTSENDEAPEENSIPIETIEGPTQEEQKPQVAPDVVNNVSYNPQGILFFNETIIDDNGKVLYISGEKPEGITEVSITGTTKEFAESEYRADKHFVIPYVEKHELAEDSKVVESIKSLIGEILDNFMLAVNSSQMEAVIDQLQQRLTMHGDKVNIFTFMRQVKKYYNDRAVDVIYNILTYNVYIPEGMEGRIMFNGIDYIPYLLTLATQEVFKDSPIDSIVSKFLDIIRIYMSSTVEMADDDYDFSDMLDQDEDDDDEEDINAQMGDEINEVLQAYSDLTFNRQLLPMNILEFFNPTYSNRPTGLFARYQVLVALSLKGEYSNLKHKVLKEAGIEAIKVRINKSDWEITDMVGRDLIPEVLGLVINKNLNIWAFNENMRAEVASGKLLESEAFYKEYYQYNRLLTYMQEVDLKTTDKTDPYYISTRIPALKDAKGVFAGKMKLFLQKLVLLVYLDENKKQKIYLAGTVCRNEKEQVKMSDRWVFLPRKITKDVFERIEFVNIDDKTFMINDTNEIALMRTTYKEMIKERNYIPILVKEEDIPNIKLKGLLDAISAKEPAISIISVPPIMREEDVEQIIRGN